MNQETLEKMSQMCLLGMYYAFKTSIETLHGERMTIDQFVSWLITSEWDDRRNRSIERAVKGASFRYKASLEEWTILWDGDWIKTRYRGWPNSHL